MQLYLRAKHFKGANFIGNKTCGCAIEEAAKDHFNVPVAYEGVSDLIVGSFPESRRFDHDAYYIDYFRSDKEKAAYHNFDDTIIRTIELIPCNP